MIYGHAKSALNDNGLLSLQDVCLQVDAATLRALASFLNECADTIGDGNHSNIGIDTALMQLPNH